MKKLALIALIIGILFVSCDNGNGTNGDEFTPSTNEAVSNNLDTLGLVGTTVSSSNTSVVTVVIDSGKIKIMSVAEGSAVITVSDGTNTATINVTVSKTGSVTIGTIVKYVNIEEYIVGTWVGSTNIEGIEFNISLILNSDNTFSVEGVSSPTPGGTYTVVGNIVTLTFKVNPPETNPQIVTLSGNVLIFMGVSLAKE